MEAVDGKYPCDRYVFDRLILDEKIPVFNYADTFGADQSVDRRTLSKVNESEEILVHVNVRYGAYQEVKSVALADVKKLYVAGGPGVTAEEGNNILGELTASQTVTW